MKKSALKWIYKNGKKVLPVMLLFVVLNIAMSLIQVKFATASKTVMDVATSVAPGSLFNAFVLLLSLILLRLVIQIFVNYLNVHSSSKFEIALKRHLFKTLINKDYLAVTQYHSGELLNRINSDVSVVVNGIMTILPTAAMLITSIVGAFYVLYGIDSTLAVVILCIGPVFAIGARVYSAKFKKMHKLCQEYDGKTKSFMLEILQNLLVVKSFGSEETMLDKSEALQYNSYKLKMKRVTVSLIANVGAFLIFNAGYYFALGYAAMRLSNGELTYGDVTAILALVSQIQSPFRSVSGLIPQAFAVSASAERLMELEELKDEPQVTRLCDRSTYEDMEKIVFDNVTFSYNDDSTVSGISMEIKKGECAVIAGESGSGKSTSVKLLLGIMSPDSGRIYIKCGNGEKNIGKETRPLFAYVPQGNLILSGTIRENIAFGKKDIDEEKIINAARVAQIWDFIEGLDKGLDTELGEKGLGLSEGQTQRISIARAILHDAPVLLLDEATSALDSVTERKLLAAIREMTDKTCIIVSHKQAAFDICDRVIYIERK